MLVYEEMSAFRHGAALAASLPLLALAGLLAWLLRRIPALPSTGTPALLPVPAAAKAVAGLAWILGAGVPLAVFARRASWTAFEPQAEFFGWSLLVSASVAAALAAWSWLSAGRSRLEAAWLALLVLPGVVAGYGVLAPAGRLGLVLPGPGLLLLALAARHAYAAWLPLREPVEPAQIEAAALAGLSPARAWWRVVRPASGPRALAVFALVFLLCLAEIGPAVLLSPPGRQTLVQQVFSAMHYGYDEAVASACLATAAAVAAGSLILAHATRAAASRVGR
jgi:ABC-type spermidine/putrescine transport system permease subunit II